MGYFNFSELREPEERLTNSVGAEAIRRAQENFHRKTGYKLPEKPIRQVAEKLVADRTRVQNIENQFSF